MLNTASSLRAPLVKREIFDPTNQAHLASLDVYLKTGNWGDVQFYHELPFVEVPITVLFKFAMHSRGVVSETLEEHTARLAAKNLTVPVREGQDSRKARIDAANAKLKADLAEGK